MKEDTKNQITMDNKVIIKRINDWLECYQNKDDGYYNATQLLRDYNEKYPNEKKLMNDFLRLEGTRKYIGVLENDKNVKSPSDLNHLGDNQQITQSTDNQIYREKSTNLKISKLEQSLMYIKKKRKKNQVGRSAEIYYFAPMLFSKFGTWLSPELERDIHKVLWNNVLEYRNSLRTMNPRFTDSVKVLTDNNAIDYIKVFGMINKAVFGQYHKGVNQRDTASEMELQMMMDIENEIIVLAKHNVIKNYDDLKNHIRSYYK